jgi:hypothetical protein
LAASAAASSLAGAVYGPGYGRAVSPVDDHRAASGLQIQACSAVNLKMAKALGLTVPPSLLA